MNSYFLNDLSLQGQYNSLEDFIKQNKSVIECISWARRNNCHIFKSMSFYSLKITSKNTMTDLGGFRSSDGEVNDLLRKYKLLLEVVNNNPFWDIDQNTDEKECYRDGNNMNGTVIAAAIQSGDAMFSFSESQYSDTCLEITYGSEKQNLYSITTPFMHSEYLLCISYSLIDDIIKHRYSGSNLDFTKMETKYGFTGFQTREVKECIATFDKFIKMDWKQIYNDKALRYKAYSPTDSKDWFLNSIFSDKNIDKFRCVNPKRCFGYREGNTFFVLRMERDHSISDNG